MIVEYLTMTKGTAMPLLTELDHTLPPGYTCHVTHLDAFSLMEVRDSGGHRLSAKSLYSGESVGASSIRRAAWRRFIRQGM